MPVTMQPIRVREVSAAIDPSSDSSVCPFASIYRYQSGCHGTRCRAKQHEAYERRKGNNRGAAVKVAKKATKATASKTTVKKQPDVTEPTPVTKKVVKRVVAKTAAA